MTVAAPRLTNYGSDDVLGATEPRLWTPPLRELTPDTSYGFDVIDFARDVLGTPLDPWEEWVVVHAGELLPDGRPRFRKVLVLVARQQGKTFLCIVLTLYWLFIEQQKLVLATSTNRDYAKESWRNVVALAQGNEWLGDLIPPRGVREANGEECLTTADGCRYKIAASNRKGGRSLTINRLILDELREHRTWDAWNASVNATNAVPDAQVWAISNQGDDESIVLDALRRPALEYIETGQGDIRLGLFEYSAPDGAEPTDLAALAMACPNLGRRTDPDALLGDAIRAKKAGGAELTGFRTEVMCQRVHLIDPAIDPEHWKACGTDSPIDLAKHRDKVALCVDVSLDCSHATLAAAAVIDGKVHVEIIRAWDGEGCTKRLRAELPAVVDRVKPRTLGWFPTGPAAAVAADLAERKGGRRTWPPRGVKVDEIRGEVTAVCMGLAEQVVGHEVIHPRDDMLDAHVQAAQKLRRGDAWAFTRAGKLPIDGVYAVAGAVHLARTLPPPRPPLAVA